MTEFIVRREIPPHDKFIVRREIPPHESIGEW
jgi:hypothetical protein